MATIDISSKLRKEERTIKIAEGKEYVVDTSADTYLIVQERLANQEFSIKSMYDMIEILMGEEALKEIKEMKLNINGLKEIIIAISAIVSEEDVEEIRKRFQ